MEDSIYTEMLEAKLLLDSVELFPLIVSNGRPMVRK